MKQDLFAIKAVESKGYDINELILRSDNELDELQLPVKIIQAVKEYKQRGGKSAQEIAQEIAEIMIQEIPEVESSTTVDDAVSGYKTNTEEQQAIIDEIKSTVVIPEDEIEIVRIQSSPADIEAINIALNEKVFKTHASYIKHLKSAVPSQILTAVDSTKLNALIEKRISDIKATDKRTK